MNFQSCRISFLVCMYFTCVRDMDLLKSVETLLKISTLYSWMHLLHSEMSSNFILLLVLSCLVPSVI